MADSLHILVICFVKVSDVLLGGKFGGIAHDLCLSRLLKSSIRHSCRFKANIVVWFGSVRKLVYCKQLRKLLAFFILLLCPSE